MPDEPKDHIFGRQPLPNRAEPTQEPVSSDELANEYALPPTIEQAADEVAYEEALFEVPETEDYTPETVDERIYPQSPHEALQPEVVIPPVLRSKKARGTLVRFFNFLMTLAFLGAVGFVGNVWYTKTQFEAKGPLAEPATFVVPKGASFNSIIPGLEAKGIIPKQGIMRVFKRGVSSSGKSSALKAGEFAFTPAMSMREVMTQLTDGRSIEYSLGFPEGWTTHKMMQRIAADKTLIGDMPPGPAEGSLLPNTYSFQKGMTRAQFVQLLKDHMQKTLRDTWNNREQGLPLKSAQELLILASIVEKETGVSSERARVASVFINRLRKGMKLQTDPTVIYGLWGGEGKPKDHGGLRRSELKKKTQYNTYQINGLPPGAIANPGIEALQAVAHPATTTDLFFVADGTGGHVFAATLKEHNANVKKWRVIEAQRKKDAAAAAAAEAAKAAGQTTDGASEGTSGN
ncbi:MAG: endolytic transglycosylase MltG [Rhizobiaceae bacterium]